MSDYFLTHEVFVEQQAIIRHIIGISAVITLGSDVAYRRYLHKQSFYMSFLLPFLIVAMCSVGFVYYLSNYVNFFGVSILLIVASIMFKLNDFLKAELELSRNKVKIVIFDLLAGPFVRYSVLISYLLTNNSFEVLLLICYFLTFGIGIFLCASELKLVNSFDRNLSRQISKLILSYIPNNIQVFALEFLAVSAIVASFSPETSRIYFIVISYCMILQLLTQSANRWYFRERLDIGEEIFKNFNKFRILSILGIYLLYIAFLPFYLMLFSLNIFNSVVFSVAALLIANTTISLVQKFFVAELLVLERFLMPNIIMSLAAMIAPLALLNFDLKIDLYLFILVCTTFLSTLIAYTILRSTKRIKTEK